MITSKQSLIDALGNGNDFTVQNEGSILILRAHTDEAREWLSENIQGEYQTFGGGIVVESRYIDDIVEGMQAAGLTGGEL